MARAKIYLIALLALFVGFPTCALADDWRIREVSGTVRIAIPARQPVAGTMRLFSQHPRANRIEAAHHACARKKARGGDADALLLRQGD